MSFFGSIRGFEFYARYLDSCLNSWHCEEENVKAETLIALPTSCLHLVTSALAHRYVSDKIDGFGGRAKKVVHHNEQYAPKTGEVRN